MFKRIDHIGFIVPDIHAAIKFYEEKYGIKPGPIQTTQTLYASFVQFDNCKIEILEPLDKNGDYMQANWLREHPEGGLHHIAYETDNLEGAIADLDKKDCKAQMAIKPVPTFNEKICFLNQADTLNVLTELVHYEK